LWITPCELGAASERLYRVTGHWTAADGLPQNSIKTLAQTSDGSLWVGTLSGLARFDGIRFKVFDHRNTAEMTHDSVNDLAVDHKDGGLWISTGNSLLYYQNHRFELYGPREGIVGSAGVLWPAAEGGAWCSPQPGEVARVRDGKVRVWQFGLGLNSNVVHQICETGHSATQLLVMLGDGPTLYKLDLASNSLQRLDVPWKEEGCRSLCLDTNEHLCLCCGGQDIWRGEGTNWTRLAGAAPMSRQLPTRVCQTSDGQIWVTVFEDGQARLHRLLDGQLKPFLAEGFLPGTSIDTLLPGREGEVWVGTEAGLYRLAPDPEAFRTFSSRDGLRSDNTLAVAAGTDDTVWVGTALGLQGIRDGHIRNVEPPPRLAWGRTAVMVVDKHNAVWIGWPNPESLWTFSGERWETKIRGPLEVQSTWEANALYEDRQGRIWVATGRALLYKNGEEWQTFASNFLSCGDVRVIYQDRRGDLWFGTFGGGLNRLRNGTFTAYKTERGDHNNRCWWIYEDADGVFWVGSEDGLNRFVPPDDAEEQGNHNPNPSSTVNADFE
jgi:ligand-binding sensor domain-containing protein